MPETLKACFKSNNFEKIEIGSIHLIEVTKKAPDLIYYMLTELTLK